MSYKILEERTPTALEHQVLRWQKDGWRLLGPPFIHWNPSMPVNWPMYYQAMTRAQWRGFRNWLWYP